ncbi:hypothetical protein [Acinetobacter sp.]|uniref:hypothetical protein n=1 Tax=Acinetobacter sp. TaxID=472 RepID=UPI00388DEEE5
MNITLLWLLALPVVCGIVVWILQRDKQDSYIPAGIYVLTALVVVCSIFFISKGSKTWDTEIWNGQVVSKERVHDTYQRSYECNCTTSTDSKGNTTRTCQTCYEDHYTVTWNCNTTVGDYRIDHEDSTSRRVYMTPDPHRYTEIQKGDPVAKEHRYTNYIQAVPNSLFTPAAADLKKKFTKLIPKYPDEVYDIYKINRFITPGWAPADAAQWNQDISLGLRELGPKKQVNVIIVIAKTSDSNYEYALRDAWEGANKNDVVLIIGSTEYPKIDFVRVLSWTKNETFKVQLRDGVLEKGVIDRSIVPMLMTQINTNFQRRQMAEFEYLDGEIDPPDWLVYTLIFLSIAGAVGVWFFLEQSGGSRMRRRLR